MRKLPIFITSILFVGMQGCTSHDTQSTEQKDNAEVSADSALAGAPEPLAEFKFQMVMANLPSPLEVLNDLNKTQASANVGLLVNHMKYKEATNKARKAMIFGAYTIGVSYLSNYNMNQEGLQYFGSMGTVAEELGLSKYYDKSYYDRFNNNLGKRDSLLTLIDGAYALSDSYLRSNDNLRTANYILLGSWIQSNYIAAMCTRDFPRDSRNSPMYKRLWMQKLHLKQLMESLDKFKKEEMIAKAYPKLQEILDILNPIADDQAMTQEVVMHMTEKLEQLNAEMF